MRIPNAIRYGRGPDRTAKRIGLAVLSFIATILLSTSSLAVTHESPEVKECVTKALKYLEGQTDHRLGGQCLISIAFLKDGRGTDHPYVKKTIEACKNLTPNAGTPDNYSLGCAVILLCEADPQSHRDSIEKLIKAVLARQKPHGGWGYENQFTGDTSQTQYAVLAIWFALQRGVDVPTEVIEKVALWLIRTQDPSGGFGYQAQDPGTFNRVAQQRVTVSLSAAGLGSLMVVGDMLAFSGAVQRREVDKKLPAALKLVEEQKKVQIRRRPTSIDPALYRRAIEDGNKWFEKNFQLQSEWNHYYFYAYERYNSFQELLEERFPEESEWYNTVFKQLRSTQEPDGSWPDKQCGKPVDTAFAVLFLSRSSRKAIEQRGRDLGEGILKGGMGLPPSTADLRENNGRLIESPLFGSVDELLAVADEKDNPELAELVRAGSLTLDKDITKRSGQVEQLRSLVRAESFEARLLAVKTLGKERQLNNVPVLLYALTDPDIRVVLEADKALRFVSRKIDGVGLEPGATREHIEKAKQDWTEWFLSIRPDAKLLD